jgi:hypothetical protein
LVVVVCFGVFGGGAPTKTPPHFHLELHNFYTN